ncbi:MAG: hypothetical protein ACOCRX_12530 [Candidatus Woesearchaeota archaeon]
MFDFEMEGFDELQKNLKKLQNKAEELDGRNNIPFDELFNNNFMRRYTNYNSIDEMIEESNFKVETEEDFKKISEDDWDEFIKKNTKFDNWQQMINKAGEEWVAKKLGF